MFSIKSCTNKPTFHLQLLIIKIKEYFKCNCPVLFFGFFLRWKIHCDLRSFQFTQVNSARQYMKVSTSCLYDVALVRKSVQDIIGYVEDSKELHQKARHMFRDIAFLTIGLPVAKPNKVLGRMYVKLKKKKDEMAYA